MTAVSSCGSKEAPAGANPLLSEWDTPYGVPPFDKIKVSDYMPAFREAMKLHREEIKAIAENPEEPDFENTVLAFDNAGEMLTRVEQVFWSVAAADTNPQMQAVQEKVAPMLSEHSDGIMLDEKLFDRIRKVYEGRDAAGLGRVSEGLQRFRPVGSQSDRRTEGRIQGDKQPAFGTDFPFREKPARRERAFPDGAE